MDARAAALLTSCRHGTLATVLDDGHPYASLVAVAADDHGPYFLLSDLAEHTRNLRRDPRASLLLMDPGGGDPLAHPRAPFVGRFVAGDRDELAAGYLARHPDAARYLDLGDFAF